MVDTNNDKYIQANLEHERLTALINSMADAVIAVDENQKVVIYNGAALNLLDINKSLVGYEIRHLIKIIDKNGHQADIESIIRKTTTQFTTRDLKLQYPDGEQINLYLSIAPVHLGYGNRGKKGHVILARDITREKSLEEERDEFISVISHELRTPIAIAEGNLSNAQFVLDRTANAPESIRQSLKSSYDQIQFLSGMINDLATLSRAERGKLSAEIESINAHELLKDFESSYTKSAQEKGLKLIIKPDPNLEVLKSSKLYVKEILQNFITNAIKYTQEGSVTITSQKGEEIFGIIEGGNFFGKAKFEIRGRIRGNYIFGARDGNFFHGYIYPDWTIRGVFKGIDGDTYQVFLRRPLEHYWGIPQQPRSYN